MEQRELFANPYMDDTSYNECVLMLRRGNAVSLCELAASNLCPKVLKQRVRPYTKFPIVARKYKGRIFLIIDKKGVKIQDVIKKTHASMCDKYIKDNLYKHEGGYREECGT